MRIWTSQFHNKQLANRPDLMAVGIVVGMPKWPLGYPAVQCRVLAPTGHLFGIEDEAEFTTAYRARLDRIGVTRIRAELQRISDEHGSRDLALCCYEDLRKPGEWCHRRVFADWWRDMTSEETQELEEG